MRSASAFVFVLALLNFLKTITLPATTTTNTVTKAFVNITGVDKTVATVATAATTTAPKTTTVTMTAMTKATSTITDNVATLPSTNVASSTLPSVSSDLSVESSVLNVPTASVNPTFAPTKMPTYMAMIIAPVPSSPPIVPPTIPTARLESVSTSQNKSVVVPVSVGPVVVPTKMPTYIATIFVPVLITIPLMPSTTIVPSTLSPALPVSEYTTQNKSVAIFVDRVRDDSGLKIKDTVSMPREEASYLPNKTTSTAREVTWETEDERHLQLQVVHEELYAARKGVIELKHWKGAVLDGNNHRLHIVERAQLLLSSLLTEIVAIKTEVTDQGERIKAIEQKMVAVRTEFAVRIEQTKEEAPEKNEEHNARVWEVRDALDVAKQDVSESHRELDAASRKTKDLERDAEERKLLDEAEKDRVTARELYKGRPTRLANKTVDTKNRRTEELVERTKEVEKLQHEFEEAWFERRKIEYHNRRLEEDVESCWNSAEQMKKGKEESQEAREYSKEEAEVKQKNNNMTSMYKILKKWKDMLSLFDNISNTALPAVLSNPAAPTATVTPISLENGSCFRPLGAISVGNFYLCYYGYYLCAISTFVTMCTTCVQRRFFGPLGADGVGDDHPLYLFGSPIFVLFIIAWLSISVYQGICLLLSFDENIDTMRIPPAAPKKLKQLPGILRPSELRRCLLLSFDANDDAMLIPPAAPKKKKKLHGILDPPSELRRLLF